MTANLTALFSLVLLRRQNLTSMSIRRLSHDSGWYLAMLRTSIHVAMKQHCSLSTPHACAWNTAEVQ